MEAVDQDMVEEVDQDIQAGQAMVVAIHDLDQDHIMVAADMAVTAAMVEDGIIDSPEAHGDIHFLGHIIPDVGDSEIVGIIFGEIGGSTTLGGSQVDTQATAATGSIKPTFLF